jgi:surface polysaccharide O-acyltransferase-like enzyme
MSTRMLADPEMAQNQTLRGLACLMVVAFHVIVHEDPSGLRVPEESFYRVFTDLFLHLRMPLFTFLSGFVYAYRPVQPGQETIFWRKKMQRLLIPLLAVSAIYFILKWINPVTRDATAAAGLLIFVFPFSHLWFLQALILLFAATVVLERTRLLGTFNRFSLVFGLTLALHLAIEPQTGLLFSAGDALYLAPFFLAGLAANRYRDQLRSRPVQGLWIALFAVAFGAYVVSWLQGQAPVDRGTFWGTSIGLTGCMTLLSLMPPVRLLAWIGGFSFSIYLYHVIFDAAVRLGLDALAWDSVTLYVLLGLSSGIAGPIALEFIVRRWASLQRILLGQS